MSSVLLTYRKLITTNVASQAINLADSGIMGHRVQCPMSIDDLNRFFIWQRTSNETAPIGHFTPHEDISGASFSYILANTLSKYYTDIDGVTGGLNFGSSVLDSNPDPTIRENGKISANDIIMAYVIYKIYGSSANPTMNVVFNLQDAYTMLPNSVLIKSIEDSLRAEEALSRDGAVNDMFQDLLSEDPTRFFDAAGKQIPGLFEVNSTDSFTGSWNFVENDRIELNVQFTFTNPVTVNSTAGDSENIESKVVIPAGATFKIRLQLLATNTPTAAAAIQKAYVAATAEELVRQAAANKEAAQKAADAFTLATQATSAAQTQKATALSNYNAAVTRNAKQLKLALAAQAAVSAAQSALAAAQLSGNQANIQQQNAAALAAEALLENQQAIADLAAADLQNAATALAKATATLNAAQSAAAAAAAAQAAANTAAANSSLALEIATATSLASTIAAATAASDPLTQALELEKNTVLDPQNLSIILAKANTATNRRKSALDTAIHTFAHQTSQLNNYNSILYTMNSALATGSNDSQLQLYKAMVVGASNILNTVTKTSEAAASTLAASYTAELTAIQHATLASSNAASLSATVAVANTNSANRSLVTATTAYVYASTMNTNAAAAAAEAQAILNTRVSNGAVMTEVQTRTQALLDANKTYAAATSTMNGALAKMTNATVAYQKASTIAVDAKVHISSVATSNLFYLSQYKTSVSTSSAYQANVLSNAKLNQIAIEVNSSLIRLNAANTKVATAKAKVSLAQLAIDTALAGGAILSELTVLKGAYSKANDSLTQALLVQAKAQAEYNAYTENAANGQVQLLQSDAMAFFNASITQKQVATDTIVKYSTLLLYATQHPTAFPPIDGLTSTEVYSTQLGIWQTYLANFQTLSQTLLTQYNTNLMRTSTLMAANPSISTSLGSLSNYYVANSNSSHLVFQANSISSLLVSLSNIGLAPPDLEEDLATYSSQSNAALDTTATAYNTYLADSLAAQSISLVSSVGQNILNTAAKFQLAQISSATMNSKMNFYTSTLASIGMIQLEYDQVSSDVSIAGQLLSNASVTNTPPSQLTLLQQKYANAVATQASLANRLNGLSATVLSSSAPKYETPSVSGIQLWLDASDPRANGSAPVNGTAITTWYNKSGNGYNATAIGSPILTSNGVQFDGISSAFTTTYPANNAEETAFMIVSIDDINVQNDLLSGELGSREYLIYGGNPTLTTIGGDFFLESGDILTSGKRTLLHFNFSSSNINFYRNGELMSSHPGSYTPPTSGNTIIGCYNLDGTQGNFFKGVLSEIITFNRTLLESERNTVEGYLAWKWGLHAELPTTHPYFLSYPTVDRVPVPTSPYTAATMLRQAELAVAKKNELVHQANTTFNKFSELNDKLQAATQSTNTVLDGISLALANGAKISEIRPLEDKLASLQKYISLTQFDAQNMYNTFITLSTLVTPDASFISTVNTNASTLYTATLNSRLNESARQVEAKQVEATAATTSLQKSEASLLLVSTQMATAVQQGLGFAELAPLRSSLEAAYLDVSHKTAFLNYTSTSLAQAHSKYQGLFTTPDIYSVFMNNSTNIATQFSTLTQSQIYQSTAINSAMNNVLTANLTNAFMGFLNYSTQTATDSATYSTLRIQYDTQISQGSNVNELSNLLDKINSASLQYSLNTQYTEQYSAAYTSSLMVAREDPAAKAILIRVAANETSVIEGAKTNTLYDTLMTAQEKLFLQNSAFINAQAEYNVANSDIQIATTNGCSADVLASKLSTLGGRGKELSAQQIKLTLATHAVQQANAYVNMNSNSMTILNSATTHYTLHSAAAQANTLYAQYAAAAENEAKTYAAVQLANSAMDSAKSVFNSSIQAGLDISSIQAYRNAVTVAGEALAKAEFNQSNAKNALNLAIQNANIDQIAQSLIVTARLTNENTAAGGAVNSAQANLERISSIVEAERISLNIAKTSNTAAVSTLTYSVSPSLNTFSLQFVNDPNNTSATSDINATVSGNTLTFVRQQVAIYGNSMNYKYLMFSAEPNAEFYIRLQDPGDAQNTIPWILFEMNTFRIIDPLGGPTYYPAESYTTSNVFLLRYDDSTHTFVYYMDNVLLYSFPYTVSNPIMWSVLNWLANSVLTIVYAGEGPPGAGMTSQEIVDIQSSVNATTSTLTSAQLAFNSAILEFNAEAALVSSLTQKFSTTTAALTLTTLNNNLLYNGFIYNEATGKYVLNPSVLPSNIQNGVPFNLYSLSVTPINLGVYNPLTPYVLGNLVYYPDSDSAQYMCALSPSV